MKDIVVIYHKDCADGFSAAWATWRKFKNNAEYIGVVHYEPLPEGLKNKIIYTLDFAYEDDVTDALIKTNKQVTYIDHHISRETAIKRTHEYAYALDHSGAVLAWKYFHPKEPIPKLLHHIEDSDLWRFKLPHTREVLSYLGLHDFKFSVWDKLNRIFENPRTRKDAIAKGKLILQYENHIIDQIVATNYVLVEFEGHRAYAVNTPKFISEIGHRLSTKMPPIGIVWRHIDGIVKVSLRSNGTVDVAKIAERYGGGGHKDAAGFSFKIDLPFPWKIITDHP